ncbi:hypothetical protein PHMEG_00038713, partial [Phytophthora megakarya]
LSELVSESRQMVQNWAMKAPETELVPLLSCERTVQLQCKDGCVQRAALGKVQSTRFYPSFSCVHAIGASVKEGKALDTLYDAKTLSISHFQSTYTSPFRPWPTDVTLTNEQIIQVPPIQSEPPQTVKARPNTRTETQAQAQEIQKVQLENRQTVIREQGQMLR